MKKCAFRLAVVALASAALAPAQSDRGTITGTVTDPASAVVPAAKLVLRNVENNSVVDGQTTATGNFTFGSLTVGNYELTVEAAGFKKVIRGGLRVEIAQTMRLDIALEVGTASESVTVTAEAPVLRTENAEQSMNVRGDKVNEMPINFGGGGSAGGGIRNWLSFIILAPGVSGTSWNSTVNGLPSGSYGNFRVYLEGQDATDLNNPNWGPMLSAASVETINEFAVQSTNFSAEFGQVAGGFYNFTTKSGTNQFHGSAYEYWANEAMDAARPFVDPNTGLKKKDRDRKNDYGFTIGGPVWIPKLYNGTNKTFFFASLEMFGNNQLSSASYSTVPTAAYRTGDFSAALTGRTLTDSSTGMTFPENGIYDPLTTQTVNGRVVRSLFPNNTVPKTRMDPVSLKIQDMIPAPVASGNTLNWLPNIVTNTKQHLPGFKVDHILSDKTRLSVYYTQQSTDSPAYPDGLPAPLTGARPKIVESKTGRVNVDHTFTPALFAHFGAGVNRFLNPDSSPESVLGYDAVGKLGLVGSALNPSGFPQLSSMGVNNQGGAGNYGPTTADHQYTTKLNFTASATWVKNQHNFKFGGESKNDVYTDINVQGAYGQYTFGNGPTAVPYLGTSSVGGGSIGAGYATFLLGQVTYSNVNAPRQIQMRRTSWALYAQDNWKVTRKLTLDLGIRWDWTPFGREHNNMLSEIGLTTPNPSAGNLPGGYIFAGSGPGRCNCQFTSTYPYAYGPRLGAAYQLNAKTVLRAGWGITYSGSDSWAYLNGGIPTAGLGLNSVTASSQFGYSTGQFQSGIVYDPAVLYKATFDPGVAPLKGSLAASPAWGPQWWDPQAGRPSRINQWNIAVQRQLTRDMSIEVAYVANRGVWEEARGLMRLNAISPARLKALGLDLTNAATRTLLTSQIGSAAAAAAGYKAPYAGYPATATVAQTLRPFPQFNDSLAAWFSPLGNNWYDSLQAKFTRRFSRGLDISSSFSWQKELCLGSSGCAGVYNAFDRQSNKGLMPSSKPFVWVTAFTWETPKVTSNRVVRQLTGGWMWGGLLRYASGNLISVASSRNNLGTYDFNTGTLFNRVAGVPLFLQDPNSGTIDPNSKNLILNPAAWVDAPAGTWGQGSAYFNDYRWQHQVSESMNFGRAFRFKERITFNIRAEFFNVFNRKYLNTPSNSNPLATPTFNQFGQPTGGFGYITNTPGMSGSRNGQLVARITF
jgi:hypothetical protein